MNQDENIEFYINNPNLLISLCQEVIGRLGLNKDTSKFKTNDIQLREIAKAVAQLEKKGIPVPDSLRAEKTKLAAIVGHHNNDTQSLDIVLSNLEKIINQARFKYNYRTTTTTKRQLNSPNIAYKTNNKLYNKIVNYIESFEGVDVKQSKTMITYFCYSKQKNESIGLVWLNYPKRNGRFKVHLRKESDHAKYPKQIIEKIPKYKKIGWGRYPEFNVRTEDDCNHAIELIRFAHEHL